MEMSKLKNLIYLISFITICFILPAIFTNRTAKTSTNDIGEEKQQINLLVRLLLKQRKIHQLLNTNIKNMEL